MLFLDDATHRSCCIQVQLHTNHAYWPEGHRSLRATLMSGRTALDKRFAGGLRGVGAAQGEQVVQHCFFLEACCHSQAVQPCWPSGGSPNHSRQQPIALCSLSCQRFGFFDLFIEELVERGNQLDTSLRGVILLHLGLNSCV